jgi:threonine dehydratase
VPAALEIIRARAERIVRVSDEEVKAAVRHFYTDTHNLIEGAGAAPFAALLKDTAKKGGRFAVIASGGNIDREAYIAALGS